MSCPKCDNNCAMSGPSDGMKIFNRLSPTARERILKMLVEEGWDKRPTYDASCVCCKSPIKVWGLVVLGEDNVNAVHVLTNGKGKE